MINIPCDHYNLCGGCSLQHLSAEAYADFKKKRIEDCLKKEGIWPVEIKPLQKILPGSRRRANLKVQRKFGKIILGYHQRKSHQLVNITMCPLLKQDLVDLIDPLRILFYELLQERDEADVYLLWTRAGVDVSLDIKRLMKISLDILENLTDFAKSQKIARLSVNNQLIVEFRSPVVSFSGVDVEAEAKSFLQVSEEADVLLLQSVRSFFPESFFKIADLFSGRGTFSFLASEKAVVDAYEMDDSALNSLQKAIKKSGKKIYSFKRNLFSNPLTLQELKVYDGVILDPPRAGAFSQVSHLASSTVPWVIYVSCNPVTFARDARLLREGGYQLISIIPIDQFLWTEHVEIVAKFEKI